MEVSPCFLKSWTYPEVNPSYMLAHRHVKYAWARSIVRVRKQSPIPNVKNLTHFRTRCHLLLPLRMRTLTSPSMRFCASRAVAVWVWVIGSHHISRKHRDPWERRRGREWRKWQKKWANVMNESMRGSKQNGRHPDDQKLLVPQMVKNDTSCSWSILKPHLFQMIITVCSPQSDEQFSSAQFHHISWFMPSILHFIKSYFEKSKVCQKIKNMNAWCLSLEQKIRKMPNTHRWSTSNYSLCSSNDQKQLSH